MGKQIKRCLLLLCALPLLASAQGMEINQQPGVDFYNDGNYEAAIKYFTKLIEQSPAYGPSYYNRGLAQAALFENEKALEDFETCLAKKPDYAEAYQAKAMVYSNMVELKLARIAMDSAIAINDLPKYRINRGKILYQLEEYHYAHDDFEKALKEDNRLDLDLLNLATRSAFEAELFSKAKIWLDRQIAAQPSNKELIFQRASCLLKMSNYPMALQDLNVCIALDDRMTKAYFYRGAVHAQMNQRREAIQDYRMVVALNPKDAYAYLQKGFLLIESGKKEEGCEDLLQSKKLGLAEAQDLIDLYCVPADSEKEEEVEEQMEEDKN